MSWQQYARELAIEIVGGILTMAVVAITVYIWPSLKKCLSKARAACYRAGSKIYTSLSGISFLDEAKRCVASFATLIVVGVLKLAYYGVIVSMLYFGLSSIGNPPGNKTVAAPESAVCDCPTPTSSVYRPRPVSARDCMGPFDVRPQYPAQSALYANDGTSVSDRLPTRKGGKGKRAKKSWTVQSAPQCEETYESSLFSAVNTPDEAVY